MKIVKKLKAEGGFLKLDDIHSLIGGIDYEITPLVSKFLREVNYKRGKDVEEYFYKKLEGFVEKVYKEMYEIRNEMEYKVNLERFDQKVLKSEIRQRIIDQYTDRMIEQLELAYSWTRYK